MKRAYKGNKSIEVPITIRNKETIRTDLEQNLVTPSEIKKATQNTITASSNIV